MDQLKSSDITIMRLKKQPHDVIACFACQGEAYRVSFSLTSLVTDKDTNKTVRDKIVAGCRTIFDRQINRDEYVSKAKETTLEFPCVGSKVRARVDDINAHEITWQYEWCGTWHPIKVRFTQGHDYLNYFCPDGLSDLGRTMIESSTKGDIKWRVAKAAIPHDVIDDFVKTLPAYELTVGEHTWKQPYPYDGLVPDVDLPIGPA